MKLTPCLNSTQWQNLWCLVFAFAIPAIAWAATPSVARNEPPAKTVEMFAGMEAGEVEVVMIQQDSTKGTVMIKNKTDKPLTVKMPEAFAGTDLDPKAVVRKR